MVQIDATCKLMAGDLVRVHAWVRARISTHNGNMSSSNRQIGKKESSAAL